MSAPLPDDAWILRARFGPAALAFATSVCIMTIEIVAGRLIARSLGSSLYTWTSVIGVVLAGLAVGNYFGGRLAERYPATRLLLALYLASSAATALILGLDALVVDRQLFDGSIWPLRVALSVTFTFLLPSAVLGTIGPVVLRVALHQNQHRAGHTIGDVYAAGAIGSIVGTFASGFFLVGQLGTHAIIWATAGALAALALLFARTSSSQLASIILGAVFSATSASVVQAHGWVEDDGPDRRYQVESDYFDIQVIPREQFAGSKDLKYPGSRVLMLDAMVHGFVVPGRPELLEYDYEQVTAALTAKIAAGRPRLSTLFIGGGAYTFPRWVSERFPGSRVDVVEIDPEVTKAVHTAMDLPDDGRIRSFAEDARVFVGREARTSTGTYDVVYGDAFNGFAVPWHLTTRELDLEVQRVLKPGGAYILNLVDNEGSERFAGASVSTLRSVFRYVELFAISGSHVRETYVICASDSPLVTPELRWEGRAYRFDAARVEALVERAGRLVLTDDFAPVDQLTTAIYVARRKY
ncbi:MAG: fused MFS/spermidine synthase [Myxococcota bacterium]